MTIENPTSKLELIEHCKLRLGAPVVKVNVTDEQYDVCVKEARQKFEEFHDEAVEQYYVVQQITAEDLTNGYFTPATSVRDIIQMLSYRANLNNLYSNGYGFNLSNGMSTYQSTGMTGLASGYGSYESPAITYYLMQLNEAYYDNILNAPVPYTWNRIARRLRVRDQNMTAGGYICYEATVSLIDEGIDAVWGVDWFIRYTTALIKRQWGLNLGKFEGMELPGGLKFNGRQIFEDAKLEIENLLVELREEHDGGPAILFG